MPNTTAAVRNPAPRAANREKNRNKAQASGKVELAIDEKALKKLKLVAVAYSHVEREWFPTDEAYEAEREVEVRAQEVIAEIEKLGVPAKPYPGDPYFFTNLLVDDPNLVFNLVDTLRGKDSLQTSVPAALELANIPYTGAGMQGMVIGNDRNLFKQLLIANEIPTPPFQYIRRRGIKVDENLGLPLIVKLNEGGGSVGIDNNAVNQTLAEAQAKVDELLATYKLPIIAERFIDGREITVVVVEDSQRRHIFMGEKVFGKKPDGKHNFTSLESYHDPNAYKYRQVGGSHANEELANRIQELSAKAFNALHFKDYAKFDVRIDEETLTPYFTDANPNTAFGPSLGLPFTEVLSLYNIKFEKVLAALLSKHAKKL
jgi:D-alanine-D-alanine ligase